MARKTHITLQDGIQWFKDGVLAIRKQPLGVIGICVFYTLISSLLSGIPILGPILAGVWMPFGGVLMGFASRDALAGRKPSYTPLIEILKSKRHLRLNLIAVGLISAGVMEIVFLVFQLLSASELSQWKMVDGGGWEAQSVLAHMPWAGAIAAFLLYLPLFMATLFSPLLIADGAFRVSKALFFSFFGVFKNLSACLMTAALLFVLTTGTAAAFTGIALLAGFGKVATFATPIIAMVLSAVAQACVWPMYRDIFGEYRVFHIQN